MIQFIAGAIVGATVTFFGLGLIMIRDEEKINACDGCIYKPYSNGERNCEKCHGVDE